MLIVLGMVSVFSVNAWALDIQVVDQHGNPVENAVVSIPRGMIDSVDTEPAVMDQVDRRFLPKVLAIKKGTQVIFPNSDNIRHHVYSFSKVKPFQIKLYKGVPKAPLSFENEGVVVLGCNIHDSMVGYIYVSPWPELALSDKTGMVTFSLKEHETLPTKVEVWHPRFDNITEKKTIILNHTDSPTTTITLNLKPLKPVEAKQSKFKKYYNEN